MGVICKKTFRGQSVTTRHYSIVIFIPTLSWFVVLNVRELWQVFVCARGLAAEATSQGATKEAPTVVVTSCVWGRG